MLTSTVYSTVNKFQYPAITGGSLGLFDEENDGAVVAARYSIPGHNIITPAKQLLIHSNILCNQIHIISIFTMLALDDEARKRQLNA